MILKGWVVKSLCGVAFQPQLFDNFGCRFNCLMAGINKVEVWHTSLVVDKGKVEKAEPRGTNLCCSIFLRFFLLL